MARAGAWSCRCGCSSNARQILDIAVWLIPIALAIDRVDHCVASTSNARRTVNDLRDGAVEVFIID